MDTYKELQAVKRSFDFVATPETKSYWVGIDASGVRVAIMDIHDIKGLSEVWPVEAVSSDQAKVRYNSIVAADAEGQKYFESFHP